MIWFEIGAVVYAVMGLFLFALCRAASRADGEVGPAVTSGVHTRRAA
jgi:hypothetical protein